jgi:NitT/TauT family transport system ATP-binding protein
MREFDAASAAVGAQRPGGDPSTSVNPRAVAIPGQQGSVGGETNAQSRLATPPIIKFDHVDFSYDVGGGKAIEDVSLSIAVGQFVAVVGPSGCGKTTLMKLCSNLRKPDHGSIAINSSSKSGRLKSVGMAFQNAALLPWRTTLDNVILPLEIIEPHRSTFARDRARHIATAERLLASVGLAGCGEKLPWQLSGGMQQRVSICRALIHNPELLLLDEPFAALDVFTREDLWCLLRDVAIKHNFTVVFVTHDLREAVLLSDVVYVMSERPGKIRMRREINEPRPREIDWTYSAEFTLQVRDLRTYIGRDRQQ